MSTASFVVAIIVQAAFDTQYAAVLKFTGEQIAITAVLFVFNCLFDYVSIIQTKVFIEFAIKSASPSKSILLLFCDAIFKMNAFILAFSAVLLSLFYFYTRTPVSVTVIFPSREISEEGSSSVGSEALVRLGVNPETAKDMALEAIPVIVAAENGGEAALLTFYATPNLDFGTLVKAYLYHLTNVVVEGDDAGLDDSEIDKIIETYNKHEDDRFHNPVVLSVKSHLSFSGLRDIDWAYTAVFHSVDAIEGGFPATLFGSNAFLEMKKAVSDSVLSMSQRGGWFYCEVAGVGSNGFIPDSMVPDNCEELGVFLESGLSDFRIFPELVPNLITAGRGLDGLWIPYTTLFITSLLPTFAFLIVSIMLLTTMLSFDVVHGASRRLSRYILRAPFTLASILLGVFLISLGVA